MSCPTTIRAPSGSSTRPVVASGATTPGVQRQYLGCVGKIDNGIVTVHLAVTKDTFQALLDADLFLPEDWAADRERCRAAGIPDDIGHRSKWQLALDQYIRARRAGLSFDWLVFDEGYGSKTPFLWVLGLLGQKFVAEVPVNFPVRRGASGEARRADEYQPARGTGKWTRLRLSRKTQQVCRALSQRCGALFRRRPGTPETRHTSEVIRYHQKRNKTATTSH